MYGTRRSEGSVVSGLHAWLRAIDFGSEDKLCRSINRDQHMNTKYGIDIYQSHIHSYIMLLYEYGM